MLLGLRHALINILLTETKTASSEVRALMLTLAVRGRVDVRRTFFREAVIHGVALAHTAEARELLEYIARDLAPSTLPE